MVKYVEVPDKQSELRYEAELARITKEHKAKLKDANDKIEALKKSHQAELEKVESDFENENLNVKFKDYYFSNVIARSSKTMVECNNSKIDLKKTGTEG